MASYLGAYTNDVGVQYRNVLLTTYYYQEGNRLPTTYQKDEEYLPSVLKQHIRRLDPKIKYCKMDYQTIRRAECYVDDNAYYEIPCPFPGGSSEMKEFFKELNNNSKFRLVNLRGEELPYSYYLVLSRL